MLLTIICLLKKLRERKKKENVCILLYLPSDSPFAVFFIPLSELASCAISLQAEKLPLAFLAVQLCLQQIISVVIYLKMMGLLINSLFSTTCSPDSYHIFQVVENLITVQCISFLKFSMCTRVHTHTLRHTYGHIPQQHTDTHTHGDILLGWQETGLDSPDLSSRHLSQNEIMFTSMTLPLSLF